ncbi:transposase [Streptomyces asiaticus]
MTSSDVFLNGTRCRPLSLLVTPGQRADCTQFEPVMDKIRVPRAGLGRPRRTPDSVSADKAYSNGKIRGYLRKRGIRHVIPEKKDHKAARLRRGSCGGRPPGFNKDRYKDRNTVERAIGKLKQFRAVATPYDKRGCVYLGTVTAAASSFGSDRDRSENPGGAVGPSAGMARRLRNRARRRWLRSLRAGRHSRAR